MILIDVFFFDCIIGKPTQKVESSSDISLDNIRAIAAENSGLRNQLVSYRKKVLYCD